MNLKLRFLLLTLTIGAVFVAWFWFHEVVLIWISVLVKVLKGVSLKATLSGLIAIFYRWFFSKLSQFILNVLVVLSVPAKYRRQVKHYMWLVREWAQRMKAAVLRVTNNYIGPKIQIVVAIFATAAVFLVSLFNFGIYFVWIFGAEKLWRFASDIFDIVWTEIEDRVFEAIMVLKTNRFGAFLFGLVPKLRSFFIQKKFRMLRLAVLFRRKKRSHIFRLARRIGDAARKQKTNSKPGANAPAFLIWACFFPIFTYSSARHRKTRPGWTREPSPTFGNHLLSCSGAGPKLSFATFVNKWRRKVGLGDY